MIEKELLEMLVCPKSREPLSVAEDGVVARVNDAIARKALKNAGGQIVETAIEGGLVCEAERLLYPVIDDIPVMLVDEAIPLEPIPKLGEERGTGTFCSEDSAK